MSELTPFLTSRPGIDQGRIEPVNFDVPEGDYLFALGSDTAGRESFFKLGDRFDVYQAEIPGSLARIIRFRGKWRGPVGTMPAVSLIIDPGVGFSLSDGQTLILAIDEGLNQTITFATAQFANIAAALPEEVAAAINSQLTGASAVSTGFGSVQVTSDTSGKRSRVRVVGGSASALGMIELGWKFSLLVDGDELASRILRPGEEQELADMGASLSEYIVTSSLEVRFRLEVVEV